jgi:NADH-quinone oxidoreductase subunit J
MSAVLMGGFRLTEAPAPEAAVAAMGNSKQLGIEIYTKYLYPLEIAAVILLVAIIAAIALTLRRRKDSKAISPAEAVRAKKSDRLRIVKMKPTVNVPAAAADAAPAATGETK